MTTEFWLGAAVGGVVASIGIVTVYWRRLSGWHAKEADRLRRQLEDSDAQTRSLYATADRMAKLLAEQAAKGRRP